MYGGDEWLATLRASSRSVQECIKPFECRTKRSRASERMLLHESGTDIATKNASINEQRSSTTRTPCIRKRSSFPSPLRPPPCRHRLHGQNQSTTRANPPDRAGTFSASSSVCFAWCATCFSRFLAAKSVAVNSTSGASPSQASGNSTTARARLSADGGGSPSPPVMVLEVAA